MRSIMRFLMRFAGARQVIVIVGDECFIERAASE